MFKKETVKDKCLDEEIIASIDKSRVSLFAMDAIRMYSGNSMSKIRKMSTIRAKIQYLKSTKTVESNASCSQLLQKLA
ncbi:hypothetical protein A3K79_02300 [Candidatus Bathyarchaeota archaeon RBG_13_46_16b]|nr:MAG: hypothetical protein A3K79_02300 [Candidatus Bathyarchaeota archaeon RBG_13_46_16b]